MRHYLIDYTVTLRNVRKPIPLRGIFDSPQELDRRIPTSTHHQGYVDHEITRVVECDCDGTRHSPRPQEAT